MNKISIIIPVYNIGEYLERCLESVINQTYNNLEIILVDDGSSDNSGIICDAYVEKDNRITVIHKENGGVSSARNVGLDIASGDYIGFVDGDDVVENDMYEKLLRNALENDAEMSVCQIDTISTDGVLEPLYKHESGELKKEYVIENYFFDEFVKSIMYSQCNKIYKRECISELRYKPYKYGEDILFVFESLGKVKTIFFDEYVGYHYIHRVDSAMTKAFSVKRYDYIMAARELVDICKREYNKTVADTAELWLYRHLLITTRALVLSNERYENKKLLSDSREELKKGKKMLKSLPTKRRVDYFGTVYCPIILKLMSKLKH